ncbi:heavy-metal-associated domain-containing protein [Bacillus sp. OV322]|uniref:heavy-metal-associated domain-containing protein n=1 Tax=Bacillus sp. OV322 TaxID=1882764 RepID=UPI000B861278|nr:heavy-metal-associated domain-containing protein [Bacillus sp. OV322]
MKGREDVEQWKMIVSGLDSQESGKKILQALESVWGINKAEIDIKHREASFSYDSRMASRQDFEQAILDLGYGIESNEQQ